MSLEKWYSMRSAYVDDGLLDDLRKLSNFHGIQLRPFHQYVAVPWKAIAGQHSCNARRYALIIVSHRVSLCLSQWHACL